MIFRSFSPGSKFDNWWVSECLEAEVLEAEDLEAEELEAWWKRGADYLRMRSRVSNSSKFWPKIEKLRSALSRWDPSRWWGDYWSWCCVFARILSEARAVFSFWTVSSLSKLSKVFFFSCIHQRWSTFFCSRRRERERYFVLSCSCCSTVIFNFSSLISRRRWFVVVIFSFLYLYEWCQIHVESVVKSLASKHFIKNKMCVSELWVN
jgi:hypothetical protein